MWDPDSNELAVEAARAHPDRFAIMGWIYLDQPAQRALLDTWKRRPGMKGLRFYFSDPQSLTWPDDGNLDWVFPVAERLGIPVSLQASAFLPGSETSPSGIRDYASASITWASRARRSAPRGPIGTSISSSRWRNIRTWR